MWAAVSRAMSRWICWHESPPAYNVVFSLPKDSMSIINPRYVTMFSDLLHPDVTYLHDNIHFTTYRSVENIYDDDN